MLDPGKHLHFNMKITCETGGQTCREPHREPLSMGVLPSLSTSRMQQKGVPTIKHSSLLFKSVISALKIFYYLAM